MKQISYRKLVHIYTVDEILIKHKIRTIRHHQQEVKVFDVVKIDNSKNQISFSEKTDYNAAQSKFELKQYEEILIQDLVNQVIFKINNYLSAIQ